MTHPQMPEIDSLIDSAAALEAARLLRVRIANDPTDVAAYHLAFKALSVAVNEAGDRGLDPDAEIQELLRLMVLQPPFGSEPRVLHHGMAALLTSGNRDTARRIVAAVMHALDGLLGTTPEAGVVLFLLIGRSVLPMGHPVQAQIPSLHLAYFSGFSKADLDLFYSIKFNAAVFSANRDDLLARYGSAALALQDTSLGFRHLLLLDRLGVGPLFQPGHGIPLRQALEARG